MTSSSTSTRPATRSTTTRTCWAPTTRSRRSWPGAGRWSSCGSTCPDPGPGRGPCAASGIAARWPYCDGIGAGPPCCKRRGPGITRQPRPPGTLRSGAPGADQGRDRRDPRRRVERLRRRRQRAVLVGAPASMSAAAALLSTCATLDAPGIATTCGWCTVQARAICAGVASCAAATSRSTDEQRRRGAQVLRQEHRVRGTDPVRRPVVRVVAPRQQPLGERAVGDDDVPGPRRPRQHLRHRAARRPG